MGESATHPNLPGDVMSDELQVMWLEFMDGVALLQGVDVSHIDATRCVSSG